jgi:hypothetical protein
MPAATESVRRALAAGVREPPREETAMGETESLHKVGNTPQPSSPQDYRAYIIAQIAKWEKLIDNAHIARI